MRVEEPGERSRGDIGGIAVRCRLSNALHGSVCLLPLLATTITPLTRRPRYLGRLITPENLPKPIDRIILQGPV